MSLLDDGIKRLKFVINKFKYGNDKTIYIDGLKNFDGVLHTSVAVKHFRIQHKNHMIIWGISDKYCDNFDVFADKYAVIVLNMPHNASKEDRLGWKNYCENLKFFKSISPLPEVSGKDHKGVLSDNILLNCGIKRISIPKVPSMPHNIKDYQLNDNFMIKNNLAKVPYVVLECNSIPINWNINKINLMIKQIKHPTVIIGDNSLKFESAIDARECTFRQQKIIIQRAACVIGTINGSYLPCCEDVGANLFEINVGKFYSAKANYGLKSQNITTNNENEISLVVNNFMKGK